MKTNEKREAALKVLAATGIRRSNYAPPLVRLLWRLGLDVPPPHFGNFWGTALFMGSFFGVGWGLIMWLFVWSLQGIPVAFVFSTAIGAGVMFGLSMAGYYAYGQHKYQ